jgi:hypothetical protein
MKAVPLISKLQAGLPTKKLRKEIRRRLTALEQLGMLGKPKK